MKEGKQTSAKEYCDWFFARQEDDDEEMTGVPGSREEYQEGQEGAKTQVGDTEKVIGEEEQVAMCLGREFEELVREQLEYERQLGLFADALVRSVVAEGVACRVDEEVEEDWDVVSEDSFILEEWEVVSV